MTSRKIWVMGGQRSSSESRQNPWYPRKTAITTAHTATPITGPDPPRATPPNRRPLPRPMLYLPPPGSWGRVCQMLASAFRLLRLGMRPSPSPQKGVPMSLAHSFFPSDTQEILHPQFSKALKGFNVDEVDDYVSQAARRIEVLESNLDRTLEERDHLRHE